MLDSIARATGFVAACLVTCGAVGASAAQAADPWPTRPVRIVVPFSASGTADLLARIVAEKLNTALGQRFIIENRPGAGGFIGQDAVTRAAPDGYTFVVSSLGSFVINPVFTPAPFDPFKDFTHIAYLGGQPVVLIANKDLPYKTLSELVAYGKAYPATITYATI